MMNGTALPAAIRLSVDIAVAHLLGNSGVIIDLVDRTLRHVLHGVEVLVGCGYVDAAAPTAGTIVILASRVGHGSTVNVELVIVEPLVLGSRLSGPHAIGILHHVVFHATDVQLHTVGLGSRNLGTHHALGVHHWIVVPLLVGTGRFEVLCHLRTCSNCHQSSRHHHKTFLHFSR